MVVLSDLFVCLVMWRSPCLSDWGVNVCLNIIMFSRLFVCLYITVCVNCLSLISQSVVCLSSPCTVSVHLSVNISSLTVFSPVCLPVRLSVCLSHNYRQTVWCIFSHQVPGVWMASVIVLKALALTAFLIFIRHLLVRCNNVNLTNHSSLKVTKGSGSGWGWLWGWGLGGNYLYRHVQVICKMFWRSFDPHSHYLS